MDEKPFMTFDFSNIEDALIPEIRKLANERFDIEATLSAAQDLKHIGQLKTHLTEEFLNPSDELVRYFARDIYSGALRSHIVEDFRGKVRLAFQHHINDIINERLQTAMLGNAYTPAEAAEASSGTAEEQAPERAEKEIVTTQEELEGFFVVKSILRDCIAPERIIIRDAKSYCAILLDNNNRKPICRLHFNAKQWYLGLIDVDKKETRHPIESIDSIYCFATELKDIIKRFEE